MRISFSPRSEPTVLYWHDRWWLPSHRIPVPFGDIGQAPDMLAAAWPGRKPVLRIVWAPASFASVAVACPEADRATVAAALAEEHPALSHPGHVWGREPVQDGRTLLHYETEPGLFAVVRRLEDLGFGVESVWPMATWLAALAPEAAGLGRVTVVATAGTRWRLYRRSAEGREAAAGDDLASLEAALRDPSPPEGPALLLHVATDETDVEAFDAPGITGRIAVWDALEKPVILPAKHPAQLLPPLPKLSLMRIVLAANLLCLVVALVAGCRLWQARQVAELQRREQMREIAALRPEVERLRANAAEFVKLTSMRRPRLPVSELLQSIATGLPSGMTPTDCVVESGRFRLAGWTDPGARDSWQMWASRWAAENPGKLTTRLNPPDDHGRWSMEGTLP